MRVTLVPGLLLHTYTATVDPDVRSFRCVAVLKLGVVVVILLFTKVEYVYALKARGAVVTDIEIGRVIPLG